MTEDFLVVDVNDGAVVDQIGGSDSNESWLSDVYVRAEIISDDRRSHSVGKRKDCVGQRKNDRIVCFVSENAPT